MKQQFIAAVAVIVLGASVFLVLKDNKDPVTVARVAAPIEVDKTMQDFGEAVITEGKVSMTYMIRNTSAEAVSILSGITSCMCTEAKIGTLQFGMHGSSGEKVLVPPGEDTPLSVIFDPMAHGPDGVGPVRRQVTLKTSSETTPTITVEFVGKVVRSKS